MIKNYSIRVKFLIMILGVIALLVIFSIVYIIMGLQSIEIIRDYSYTDMILEEYYQILNIGIAVIAIITILSLIIAYVLLNSFIRPISNLINASNDFLKGNYFARANLKVNDEIGLVGEALNKMAESIEDCNRVNTSSITHVSHELKTPLNVIYSSVQLIESYKKNLDCETYKIKVSKQMDIIRQNCFRMMRLAGNIIDLNRYEKGFVKINLDNYDIVKLIKDITFSVKRYTESKGIHLKFESSIQSRTMACDPDVIERIILNLISNAIKFTDKNGTITVKITEVDNDIIFSVTDTGIGISESKLNRIFELFNQTDDHIIRNKEGSGIGLYLVKAFVEAHKGSICVSRDVSVGTTFEITIPIQVLDKGLSSSVKESSLKYEQPSSSKNLVSRINIEFSDIYSCYDDET